VAFPPSPACTAQILIGSPLLLLSSWPARGKYRKGSYLIVENLDRLTREDVRPALSLFLQLLDYGINIAQLEPENIYLHDKTDEMQIMMAIMELRRGNSESQMKSVRVGAAWEEKRNNAGKEILTKRCPYWLRVVDDKFEKVPERADLVRQIFQWTIDGLGYGSITKRLNEKEVSPWGGGKHWQYSYVMKILTNPAAYGEYQPYTRRKKSKRKPIGEPVPNYYPAVVAKDVSMLPGMPGRKRRGASGPNQFKARNLFSGLLWEYRDDCQMLFTGELLVSYLGKLGKGTFISFPYKAFEEAVLKTFREISPSDFAPKTAGQQVDRISVLDGQIAEIDAQLGKMQKAMEEGGDVVTLVKAARSLEAKKKSIVEERDEVAGSHK